jgi:serpin B
VRAVARSSNAFALDLYARLKSADGNVCFSPISVSTALTMASAGARGETARQMASVLRSGLPPEKRHGATAALAALLTAGGRDYRFDMANRLWGQTGVPFRPEFLGLTRNRYGAELARLDFRRPAEACAAINGWVERQTQGRITDILSPDGLDPDTRLVLTNAVYFKGAWADPFEEPDTTEVSFRLVGGGAVSAPLMRQTGEYRYAEAGGETNGLQLVELPYLGRDLSMVVLLPRRVGAGPLELKLAAANLGRWVSGLKYRRVAVSLPRFRTTSTFHLSDTLSEMGMPLAFAREADFSGMTDAERLYVGSVAHKAFIEVSERGTEAAAATAVEMKAVSAEPPEEPVEFRADRPFVYLIRDVRTGVVLFLGRVADPTK